MQEPDARLGRIDSNAVSNAINSIGNIQNSISQGVANQLNIINNYMKARQEREAQERDINFKKDEAQKERIFRQQSQDKDIKYRQEEGREERKNRVQITNLNNQAQIQLQRERQDNEVNLSVWSSAVIVGDVNFLTPKRDKKGNIISYYHKVGRRNVLLVNPNHEFGNATRTNALYGTQARTNTITSNETPQENLQNNKQQQTQTSRMAMD